MQTLVLVLIMFEYSECGGEAVCRGLAVVRILGYTLNILNSGGHWHSWVDGVDLNAHWTPSKMIQSPSVFDLLLVWILGLFCRDQYYHKHVASRW